MQTIKARYAFKFNQFQKYNNIMDKRYDSYSVWKGKLLNDDTQHNYSFTHVASALKFKLSGSQNGSQNVTKAKHPQWK
jgi:hypothetical protein